MFSLCELRHDFQTQNFGSFEFQKAEVRVLHWWILEIMCALCRRKCKMSQRDCDTLPVPLRFKISKNKKLYDVILSVLSSYILSVYKFSPDKWIYRCNVVLSEFNVLPEKLSTYFQPKMSFPVLKSADYKCCSILSMHI